LLTFLHPVERLIHENCQIDGDDLINYEGGCGQHVQSVGQLNLTPLSQTLSGASVTSILRQLGATVDTNTVHSYKLCLQTSILNSWDCSFLCYHITQSIKQKYTKLKLITILQW